MGSDHLAWFLFANLTTSCAYGAAFVLFVNTVETLARRRSTEGKLNLPLAILSTLIFLFATLNVGGMWANAYMAFIVHVGIASESYIDLISTPSKTSYQTGEVAAIILADIVVVYRAWVLWNHNCYIIVIPCLTFIVTVISGVYFVALEHHTSVYTSIFSPDVTRWTLAFLLCSLATTVYSTAVIMFILLRSQHRLCQDGVERVFSTHRNTSWHVMRILAESAALYSLNHLLYAILYKVESNAQLIPSSLEASIASITCSMIIVRAAENASRCMYPSTLHSLVFLPASDTRTGSGGTGTEAAVACQRTRKYPQENQLEEGKWIGSISNAQQCNE